MTIFDIWAEGYSATGESGGAVLLGRAEGANFEGACNNLAKTDTKFAKYYNAEALTYWGCALYDSQSEAIKTFG